MLNNIDNTTFKANLRITTPVKDKARLENIQKLFSERTSEMKDTLSLSTLKNWGNAECVYLGKEPESSLGAFFKATFESMMETMPDSDIADKMVKSLKAFRAVNKREYALLGFESEKRSAEFEQKRNSTIAQSCRSNGDEVMAKRFDFLANCFGKKLAKFKTQEEKINNRFFTQLAEIAQGDEDILNFKDCID